MQALAKVLGLDFAEERGNGDVAGRNALVEARADEKEQKDDGDADEDGLR